MNQVQAKRQKDHYDRKIGDNRPSGQTGLKRILAFDKRIRYCCLIDSEGKQVAFLSRTDLLSLEPVSEDERLFRQISIAVSMDKGWDKYFGRTKCIVIAKERVNLFIYSLRFQSIVITTDPELSSSKMKKLGELVDTSEFPMGSSL